MKRLTKTFGFREQRIYFSSNLFEVNRMRLEKIKLAGFKSFVDPTTVRGMMF